MSKKRILIIDDDNRNIFALTATLKAKGFECLACTSANEGITLLHNDKKIAAVLMDMMMPEMDGYQAIPQIKKIEHLKHVPVFAVTAQAMQGDKEKCLQAGADGYISKPINVDTMMQLLAQFNIQA
ncbi:MAG: response regulator [Bacteroidota bacterium]